MSSRSIGAIALLALLILAASAFGASAIPFSTASHAAAGHDVPVLHAARPVPVTRSTPTAVGAFPTTVPTGTGPVAVLVDPTNQTAYVANEFSSNVSVISLTTERVVATVHVGSTPYPQAIALDPVNWTVYVANFGSDNVSVISASGFSVITSVPVGTGPDAIAYNPANHELYVANAGSGSVSIISPVAGLPKVIATVPVGPDPDALAVDSVTHNVFVADADSGNISVISAKTNVVIRSVIVGEDPGAFGAMAFDPQDNDLYVANLGSDNVSVIGGTNFTYLATVTVGTEPTGLVVDPLVKKVFVANHFSDDVTVISTLTNLRIASVPVGIDPAANGGIGVNPTTAQVYVPNSGSDNVSVIGAVTDKVAATVPCGNGPDAVGTNNVAGSVYVANQGSGTVTAFALSQVTFDATGLASGTAWSVTAGTPPAEHSNTTVKAKGAIEFLEPVGTLAYTITPPTGFGVSSVSGPLAPTQQSANVTGPTTVLTVKFGPVEPLTFTETGLRGTATWGITIHSTLRSGGPTPQTETAVGAPISFTVVKDAYKFTVSTLPNTVRAVPSHGSVSVGKHAVTKSIRFVAYTAAVIFKETGLAAGTRWQVNLTGPINTTASSTKPTIRFLLVSGTYDFAVWNFSALHPHPATGVFTVAFPPAPLTEPIGYNSSAAGHAVLKGATPRSGGAAAPVAGPELLGAVLRGD